MTEYKLYNFSLGENPIVKEFDIGPYKIKLIDDYDDLGEFLSYNNLPQARSRFVGDEEIWDFTEIENLDQAKPLHTANVYVKKEPNAILSEIEAPAIWDLIQIFSFLSGRSVYTENELNRFHPYKYNRPIVSPRLFVNAANTAWDNRKNLHSENGLRPFSLYLASIRTPEIEAILLLCCISLEIIQNNEWEISSNRSVVNTISNERLSKLIGQLRSLIDQSEIDTELKDNLKNTVASWDSPHSIDKLIQTFENYGIVKIPLENKQLKRIKYINKLRNSVCHQGKLVYPKWINDQNNRKRIAFIVSREIVPYIVRLYIVKKFKLDDCLWEGANIEPLKDYVNDGKWNGIYYDNR